MQTLVKLKNKKGFTLIEMLIVILIIVILLAIAVPSVIAYREDSQRTADLGAAKTVYTALEASLTTFGELPGPDDSPPNQYSDYQTIPGTTIIYHKNTGNGTEILTTSITPSTFNFGIEVNGHLGNDFYGNYKFGYDTTTNAIVWVSYHHDNTTVLTNGRHTAADSDVMLYHVADDVSGYLDESEIISKYGSAGNGMLDHFKHDV